MVLGEPDFRGTERFVVRRRLGAGSLGVVYEAEDREQGEVVAIKVLRGGEPEDIYRLKKEFRTLVDVSHPNLVSLYELIADKDEWFFTMELVDGTDFLNYVRGAGEVLTSAQLDHRLRSAFRQLTVGVAALHQTGRLHRDLKPSNVMVARDGRVVILDFGISAELRQPFDPGMGTTDEGVWGTPAYMSPEQFFGETSTEASDWYAVGGMLYEALAGKVPFTGRVAQLMMSKRTEMPAPPAALSPSCPGDLSELAMALLAREPGDRPAAEEILRRAAADPSAALARDSGDHGSHTELIGRRAQLDVLESAYEASAAGTAVTVYIRGPSGIGKSALVRSFLDRVSRREGAIVLTGRCYVRESVPHKALDGIVESLSRHLRSVERTEGVPPAPEHVSALLRTFPVLERVEALARAAARDRATYDAIEMRRAAFRALRDLIAALAMRRPIVLAIDDLQWADDASVHALEDLVSEPNPPPVLLIASFRSEEIKAHAFLEAAIDRGDSPSTRQLTVDRLSREETEALVGHLLGDDAALVLSGLVSRVAAESGGSPFLAEQLTRYVEASGGSSGSMARVSFAEMLAARIAQLPTDARPFLMTLAVAARPLDEHVAAAAAQTSSPTNALVIALAAANLVRSSQSARRVELYHDRIRETLSASLSDDERRAIHLQLAQTLVRQNADDPEALYEHYFGAGDIPQAAAFAAIAARKAAAALAFDRAASLYRRALDLAQGPALDRGALTAELAEALTNSGRMGDAARAFEAAAIADPGQALEYHRRAAEQFLMGGHTDDGLAVLRRVLDGVNLKMPEGPKKALALFLLRRVVLWARGVRFAPRRLEDIPAKDIRQVDICWAGAAGLALTEPIRALHFQSLYILLALRAGEPRRIARAFAVQTSFSAAGGGKTRAKTAQWQRRAADFARELDDVQAIARAGMTEGVAAFLVGEWKCCATLCENAERLLLANPTGMTWELATSRNFWVGSTTYLGDIAALARRIPVLLQDARERGNRYFSTQVRIRGIILWLAHDDPERGRAEVDDAMSGWSTSGYFIQHFSGMNAGVQIDLYANDPRGAWQRVMTGWPPLRQSLLLRVQMLRVEAMVLRARAALACAASGIDTKAMLDDAARCARSLERERMGWTAPMAGLMRGGHCVIRGDLDAARVHFATAGTGFESADMPLLASAARRRLGELTGGSEGAQLVDAADAVFRNRGVVSPSRFTSMSAPGLAPTS